jgi:UDP-N-acetylmuramate--alanine ligase
LGTNARLGHGEYIVAEADESDASFLLLTPVVSVITNIDADHMDTYGHDFGRLTQAYVDFANRLPFYGLAVLCFDDAHVRAAAQHVARRIVSYGLGDEADVRAVDVECVGASMRFTVVTRDPRDAPLAVTLNLPGTHNVQNALAAIAIAREVGASDDAIAEALARFDGVGRRFQRYGGVPCTGGHFTLVDDYGHHPAEIAATIAAARGAFGGRRVLLAFQPHRYTRTRDLFADFATVIATADEVLLTEIYPAGESPIAEISGLALAARVQAVSGKAPNFVSRVDDVAATLLQIARADDVVLVMGAGSIGHVAQQLALAAAKGERT